MINKLTIFDFITSAWSSVYRQAMVSARPPEQHAMIFLLKRLKVQYDEGKLTELEWRDICKFCEDLQFVEIKGDVDTNAHMPRFQKEMLEALGIQA